MSAAGRADWYTMIGEIELVEGVLADRNSFVSMMSDIACGSRGTGTSRNRGMNRGSHREKCDCRKSPDAGPRKFHAEVLPI